MPVINVRKNSGSNSEYTEAYPTDVYTCIIQDVKVVQSKFENKDGGYDDQLMITWEVSDLTEDQKEDGLMKGKRFWQYVSLYGGTRKNGSPTKFQKILDALTSTGQLDEDYDTDALDTDDLIEKTARVSVEQYDKDGEVRNKVVDVLPIRKRRNAPVTAEPAPVKRNRPTAVKPDDVRRAPVAADVGDEDDDELFS